jgi:hypothetical protein
MLANEKLRSGIDQVQHREIQHYLAQQAPYRERWYRATRPVVDVAAPLARLVNAEAPIAHKGSRVGRSVTRHGGRCGGTRSRPF